MFILWRFVWHWDSSGAVSDATNKYVKGHPQHVVYLRMFGTEFSFTRETFVRPNCFQRFTVYKKVPVPRLCPKQHHNI